MQIVKLLVLFVFLFASTTSADEKKQFPVIRDEYMRLGEQTYKLSISKGIFDKMNKWNPDVSDQPPVTVKAARDLARKGLEKIKIPQNCFWLINRIELGPMTQFRPEEKWIYIVRFDLYSKGFNSGKPFWIDFYVTMDGELIEPVVESTKKKK